MTTSREAQLKNLYTHLEFKTPHRYRAFSLHQQYQKRLSYPILGGITVKNVSKVIFLRIIIKMLKLNTFKMDVQFIWSHS